MFLLASYSGSQHARRQHPGTFTCDQLGSSYLVPHPPTNSLLCTTHSLLLPCGPDAPLCCPSRRGWWDTDDLNRLASSGWIFYPPPPPYSTCLLTVTGAYSRLLLRLPYPFNDVWIDKVKCQSALTAEWNVYCSPAPTPHLWVTHPSALFMISSPTRSQLLCHYNSSLKGKYFLILALVLLLV